MIAALPQTSKFLSDFRPEHARRPNPRAPQPKPDPSVPLLMPDSGRIRYSVIQYRRFTLELREFPAIGCKKFIVDKSGDQPYDGVNKAGNARGNRLVSVERIPEWDQG